MNLTMSKRLFMLRHAQSRFNAYEIVEKDTDLSELGVQQASSINCDRAFDTVVCSPLRRYRKTLELSGIKYKNLIIKSLARGYRFTESDTLPEETFTGMEKEEEFASRIKELRLRLHEVLKTTDSLLLVSHYFVINILTSLDSNGEMVKDGIEPSNGQIYQYELP